MTTTTQAAKSYSGIFGRQVVIKGRKGKSIMTLPLVRKRKPPTARQREVYNRLRLASQFAKRVLETPGLMEQYRAKSRKGLSADSLKVLTITCTAADLPGNTAMETVTF